MLVKIIAAGLTPTHWRKALRQLRAALPDQPFSVGMFTTDDELDYFTGSFYPHGLAREAPDFIFCPAPPHEHWESLLPLLRALSQHPKSPALVLAFHGLEAVLSGMISAYGSLELTLDSGNLCTVSDSAILAASFPADFPRIKVDSQLTALRFKEEKGDVPIDALSDGTVVGFAELEAILQRDERLSPKGWLKGVLAGAGAKRAPRAAGLIKEAQGLFLFPGVPLPHVSGVTIAGAKFTYLLDLEQLHPDAPQFVAFASAVHDTGQKRLRAWKSHTMKIRQAEAKNDIPVICAGAGELLRESLAALLVRQGHHRCFTLAAPEEGVIREPSLLLQVSPWEKGQLGAQTSAPLVMDISEEMDACMKPVERLLPWRDLKFQPPPVDIAPLPKEAFIQQRKRLSSRATRMGKKLKLEDNRSLLMSQEEQVLQKALAKLGELLDSGGAYQVWSGEALQVNKLLLFSYDQEEAAAVMQSLPHIGKKRWLDLAAFTTPDTMQNLDLDELRHYGTGGAGGSDGAIRVTPSARERLEAQWQAYSTAQQQAREELDGNQSQMERLRGEMAESQRAQEELARHWMWETLSQWLRANRPRMARALDTLRERQENRWFNRAHVRRALILSAQQENGGAILEACESVYPGFSKDLSIVVPYEFDLLDALPEDEAASILEDGRAEGLAAGGIAERTEQALGTKNEALFADFLQLVSSEMTGVRTDLVLIEHQPAIASRILEHLRRAAPRLAEVPAVLILSDLWSPPANKPLPWPRTRIVLIPRMGALTAGDCAEHLRALYPD